ncbi:hypothetical protein B0G74_6732 [Paraburkholderia sp. BL9I2N2]|jgi:hypothetical protein|nr:hypothetical protein B0G74_6732 [Paraburkholderia sp. BL9I2N2]
MTGILAVLTVSSALTLVQRSRPALLEIHVDPAEAISTPNQLRV